jgi:hypothetical protein
MLAQIPGGGTLKTFTVTLASGAATIKTGLSRYSVLSIIPWHASTITGETFGVIGAPNTSADATLNGMLAGDLVIESSGGSSTSTVIVTVFGY